MFAIVKDEVVQKLIQPGQQFSYNNMEYPSFWFATATPEAKAELGIVDVVYDERPNDVYYWVSEQAPRFDAQLNQVIISFNRFPKDVAGLKSMLISQINQSAWTMLQPSDWMAVKAFETGVAMSDSWKVWRQQVRDQVASQVVAINACTTADELAVLPSIQWPTNPNEQKGVI